MSERIVLYDSANTEYETAELLLARWDGTRIFRLAQTPELKKEKINVVIIPPADRPVIRPAEQKQIRSSFSCFPGDGTVQVLYPQRMVEDDFGEVRGYLGWLPDEACSLIPFSEYTSDPFQMLTAARILANMFAAMGDDRARLRMVDPDGFYTNTDGTRIYYLSADISDEVLSGRDGYVSYIPPELLVFNRFEEDESGPARAADYVLSVLLYRLFVGSCPFSGENLADQICDGISVFYDDSTPEYSTCIERLRSLDPELIPLFRLAFDYSGCSRYTTGRPTAAAWRHTLNGILVRKHGRE